MTLLMTIPSSSRRGRQYAGIRFFFYYYAEHAITHYVCRKMSPRLECADDGPEANNVNSIILRASVVSEKSFKNIFTTKRGHVPPVPPWIRA